MCNFVSLLNENEISQEKEKNYIELNDLGKSRVTNSVLLGVWVDAEQKFWQVFYSCTYSGHTVLSMDLFPPQSYLFSCHDQMRAATGGLKGVAAPAGL